MTPFQRLLGAEFERLPAPVRDLHGLSESVLTAGRADITAAANPAAWLLCRIAGLPCPGRDVPVTIGFHPDGQGRELWERQFAGRRYASTMAAGTGRDEGLLFDSFGPFTLLFRLTPGAEKLVWTLTGWRLLGVTLPRWSLPRIGCVESGEGSRFVFDIDVAFPIAGHVLHYRGWIERA